MKKLNKKGCVYLADKLAKAVCKEYYKDGVVFEVAHVAEQFWVSFSTKKHIPDDEDIIYIEGRLAGEINNENSNYKVEQKDKYFHLLYNGIEILQYNLRGVSIPYPFPVEGQKERNKNKYQIYGFYSDNMKEKDAAINELAQEIWAEMDKLHDRFNR